MPIVNADTARWSNANMAANTFEQRCSQGAKEHTGQEGKNAGSAANQHEQRIQQETGSH